MTTATEILEAIKELSIENEVLGLRANNDYFGCDLVTVGSELPCSHCWDDGEPTDYELEGTCAMAVGEDTNLAEVTRFLREYGSLGQLMLITGSSDTNGEDLGECIIRNAKVVATF
jgi:hypothetical protein